MATFNVVVSDPETGRSFTREVDGQDANRFIGREIGEDVEGSAVGLDGFTLEITGGSDDAGRPMRPDVKGADLSEVLLSGGIGYNPDRDGERRRVTVRGREVGEPIAQLNVAVTGGDGSVAVALGEEAPEVVETDTEEADEPEDEAETEAESEDNSEREDEEGAEESETEADSEADESEADEAADTDEAAEADDDEDAADEDEE
jgi:small subunit ribosomal protein S6e